MLNIYRLTLGDYQVNCYIVHASGCDKCVIIDPGYDAPAILSKLQALGLTPEAILLTHGHFDHVGAVEDLLSATGCRLYMCRQDWTQKQGTITHFFYPLANQSFETLSFCGEGETISAAGLAFSVLDTPGHTWGSVCFLCENALFTGDTLFAGSCGRTDLPGGSAPTLGESLSRLRSLEADWDIYPGHGSPTTLSREKTHNPYLR